MHRPRFSITFLLVLILLIGVGLAALTRPSELWDSLLFSVDLMILHAAIVGIVLSRGRHRAFWTAFAVFGWGYLILSSAPWISQPIRPRLLSNQCLFFLYPRLVSLPTGVSLTEGILVGDRAKLSSIDVFNTTQAEFRYFFNIGHLLTDLTLALIAGYAAWIIVSRTDRPMGETATSR